MIARRFLLFLSRQSWLRNWVETSSITRPVTHRFVAGETLEEVLDVCSRLNSEGILATLDHLGENIRSIEEAASGRDAYLEALQQISERNLKATVSIKLTHFGLDFSERVCCDYVSSVITRARELGKSVEFDMESFEYVDRTLQIVADQHRAYPDVRVAIQAYLRRSEEDVNRLCEQRIPVRLCKGAYRESPALAFTEKRSIDHNYVSLMRALLQRGVYPALATHDERIVREAIRTVDELELAKDQFEFQMLYGIRRNLQRCLVRDGFRVRVYVPYGVAWYPYLVRRMAERPANVLMVARNVFQG